MSTQQKIGRGVVKMLEQNVAKKQKPKPKQNSKPKPKRKKPKQNAAASEAKAEAKADAKAINPKPSFIEKDAHVRFDAQAAEVMKNPTGNLSFPTVEIEIEIPSGQLSGLGVVIQGIRVSAVSPNSPVDLEIGDVVVAIIFGDGTEMRQLRDWQIGTVLSQSSTDPHRKLIIARRSSSPSRVEIEIEIPSSKNLGVAFEGDPATVSAVAPDSPVDVEVGDVVVSFILGDGSEMTQLSAKALAEALSATRTDPNRRLIIDTAKEVEST